MKIIITLKTVLNQSLGAVRRQPVWIWGLVILAFAAGLVIRGGGGQSSTPAESAAVHTGAEQEVEWWTCSMHPQIRLPQPGQCPICFMDLIPLESSPSDLGPRELKLSATARKLAEIETSPVRRGLAEKQLRLSGKVEYDETRLGTITAWVPGRLERLFVDYTGITVQKGDHLVEIYSPELYATQEELLQALRRVRDSASDLAQSTARVTLEATREKLSLLGLTAAQIRDLETRNIPVDKLTIYSPMAGIVIRKHAVEGMYVKTGMNIYTIADLSRVWVMLDAYESDLAWLHFGQEVEFTTEALPGRTFQGRVTFIDPILDSATRTVKVRLNIANPDMKLKPGMFVRAVVKSVLDAGGRAVNPTLAGQWVCPMHPEIVKDGPGTCDVCGMPLERAEELGIVAAPADPDQPLLVPAGAVLKTGKRALVYVMKMVAGEPVFESREIILGPRVGEWYIVLSGLSTGEEVVTRGNFKIDSAMQIAAKPSMMSPAGGPVSTGHEGHGAGAMAAAAPLPESRRIVITGAFRKTVDLLLDSYFVAQQALAADDFKQAKSAMFALGIILQAAETRQFDPAESQAGQWPDFRNDILAVTQHAQHWSGLEEIRPAFASLSRIMLRLEQSYGHSAAKTVYEVFCPMAFNNQGAAWLQTDTLVFNPYFGAKMLRCGEIRSQWEPVK